MTVDGGGRSVLGETANAGVSGLVWRSTSEAVAWGSAPPALMPQAHVLSKPQRFACMVTFIWGQQTPTTRRRGF